MWRQICVTDWFDSLRDDRGRTRGEWVPSRDIAQTSLRPPFFIVPTAAHELHNRAPDTFCVLPVLIIVGAGPFTELHSFRERVAEVGENAVAKSMKTHGVGTTPAWCLVAGTLELLNNRR